MGYYDWDGTGSMMSWAGFDSTSMFIYMFLFPVLLIVGIFILFKYLDENNGIGGRTKNKSSIEILEERYAKGEIEKKEFEEKKKDILHS